MGNVNISFAAPTQAPQPSLASPRPNSLSAVKSDTANLSDLSLDQVATLADKAFSALGKDGIKFLPFLVALVNAFKQPGADGGGATAGAGVASPKGASAANGGKADIGSSTQALLAFRNANSDVKDLDQILGSISKALPNLSQADFESILNNLKTASASAKPATGSALGSGKAEIDKFELSLLEAQLSAATSKTSSASGSATGNKILDTIISAIAEIGKDGVTPEEMKSLVGILADTAIALLGPDKATEALNTLGLSSPDSTQANGSAMGLTANNSAAESTPRAAVFAPTIRPYDPERSLTESFARDAAAVNYDPFSTGGRIALQEQYYQSKYGGGGSSLGMGSGLGAPQMTSPTTDKNKAKAADVT